MKLGDQVKAGDKIGECGNSGNSSEPHVHFHLQSSFIYTRYDEDWAEEFIGKAVEANFKSIMVSGDKREHYSPVKGNKVSNP